MADGRADDRRDELRWGPVCAAGVVAAYSAVLPANPRHFYTADTEAQYAPLWVMTGRSLWEGKFPVPGHRPAHLDGRPLPIDVVAPGFFAVDIHSATMTPKSSSRGARRAGRSVAR